MSVPSLRQLCDDAPVLELWQAEWCPYSHRVRLRLTELELDWIARDDPCRPCGACRHGIGDRSALDPDARGWGRVVQGADEILAYLDALHPEPHDAARHRAQMRVEWPHWLELEGGGQGS